MVMLPFIDMINNKIPIFPDDYSDFQLIFKKEQNKDEDLGLLYFSTKDAFIKGQEYQYTYSQHLHPI